jgi:hypothetical protein
MERVSACAIARAESQIGVEQFKQDYSVDGAAGNRIFLSCCIQVRAARVAILAAEKQNQAPRKAPIARGRVLSVPAPRDVEVADQNLNNAHQEVVPAEAINPNAVAAPTTDAETAAQNGQYCDETACYASPPVEGDPNFIGPLQQGATSQGAETTNTNTGTMNGNGEGI